MLFTGRQVLPGLGEAQECDCCQLHLWCPRSALLANSLGSSEMLSAEAHTRPSRSSQVHLHAGMCQSDAEQPRPWKSTFLCPRPREKSTLGGRCPSLAACCPGLPKTRSGKIMRRVLRKIAAKEEDQLGDTSTLAGGLLAAHGVCSCTCAATSCAAPGSCCAAGLLDAVGQLAAQHHTRTSVLLGQPPTCDCMRRSLRRGRPACGPPMTARTTHASLIFADGWQHWGADPRMIGHIRV